MMQHVRCLTGGELHILPRGLYGANILGQDRLSECLLGGQVFA
jgi:hypothetical protein